MSTRERKYRAWDPEDQCFAYFTLVDVDERGCIKVPHGTMRLSFIDPELITESTGLRDKNGLELWEGDVRGYGGDDDSRFVVTYRDGSFRANYGTAEDGYPIDPLIDYFHLQESIHLGNIFEQ